MLPSSDCTSAASRASANSRVRSERQVAERVGDRATRRRSTRRRSSCPPSAARSGRLLGEQRAACRGASRAGSAPAAWRAGPASLSTATGRPNCVIDGVLGLVDDDERAGERERAARGDRERESVFMACAHPCGHGAARGGASGSTRGGGVGAASEPQIDVAAGGAGSSTNLRGAGSARSSDFEPEPALGDAGARVVHARRARRTARPCPRRRARRGSPRRAPPR